MQKVLHKAGQIEVADQQAAASNLNMDSFFSSHKFNYVFIWDVVRKLHKYIAHDNHCSGYERFGDDQAKSNLERDWWKWALFYGDAIWDV